MTQRQIDILEKQIMSPTVDVTKKHQALFALRNIATPEAARVLEQCLLTSDESRNDSEALLKHELAYALGQVGVASSAITLERVLADAKVHPMVRHEV